MLDKLRNKLARPVEELESDRLKTRIADLGVVAIADSPERTPVLLAGEVQGLQVVPRSGSSSVEITIDDGTGRAVAVFTGRRRIGGLDVGRRVLIEGVGRKEKKRLVVVNPAYTIIE